MKRTFAAGLLQRRECTLPTWRGWLALLAVIGLLVAVGVRMACQFLTIETAAPGDVLVVEGWISPGDARQALVEFRKGHYAALYVTGGPIEPESPLASFGSYAELTADVLRRLGADPATLHAVPGPLVAKDRTYSTAVALRKAMQASGVPTQSINVMTTGMHARRSRLLYEKAFGPGTRIGVVPLEEHEFDPNRWWTTSAGFRTVSSEVIAYFYARVLFYPPAE